MKVKIEKKSYMPVRAHIEDAGLDLRTPKGYILYPNSYRVIDTGVAVSLPKNTVGYIKARSSLFSRGVLTDGTIDEGYTGTIKVVLWNIHNEMVLLKRGDKIAQLVIHPIEKPELEQVDSLEETDRGDGGFGSTGR